VDIVLIETEPVFLEFEFVGFQINIHSLAYGLSDIYPQKILLERLDDWVIGLLRVEISVCVEVLEKLDTFETGEEISDIGVQAQINAIGVFIVTEI
jgi:hypothetical protein